MNFFIKLIKRIFNKDKIKYISAPIETTNQDANTLEKQEESSNNFRINLIHQADPEIRNGDGYKIDIINIKDLV